MPLVLERHAPCIGHAVRRALDHRRSPLGTSSPCRVLIEFRSLTTHSVLRRHATFRRARLWAPNSDHAELSGLVFRNAQITYPTPVRDVPSDARLPRGSQTPGSSQRHQPEMQRGTPSDTASPLGPPLWQPPRAAAHVASKVLVLHGCLMPAWATEPAMGSPCYHSGRGFHATLSFLSCAATPGRLVLETNHAFFHLRENGWRPRSAASRGHQSPVIAIPIRISTSKDAVRCAIRGTPSWPTGPPISVLSSETRRNPPPGRGSGRGPAGQAGAEYFNQR